MKTLSKDANELIISLMQQQIAGKITRKDVVLLEKLLQKKMAAETPAPAPAKAPARAKKTAPAKAPARAMKTAPASKVAAVKKIQIIENYSEKSFAVIGETKPLKSTLKELHGRFNPWLNIEGQKVAGWIFSARALEDVKTALGI